MKKLLILLATMALASCAENKPQVEDIEYYNPIEGLWERTLIDGRYLAYEFNSDFTARYTVSYEGRLVGENNYSYTIDDEFIDLYYIQYNTNEILHWAVINDELYLYRDTMEDCVTFIKAQ